MAKKIPTDFEDLPIEEGKVYICLMGATLDIGRVVQGRSYEGGHSIVWRAPGLFIQAGRHDERTIRKLMAAAHYENVNTR